MSVWRHVAFSILFILLCTANSAGYRYGASDQAFYVPAVLKALHPDLFPHDAPLLAAQARLTVVDEAIAAIARTTGASLPWLFLALYCAALLLLFAAAIAIGQRLYRNPWTIAALGAALTLRHAVAKTGANTLEPYFHPRMLAFACGLAAVALFLRRRDAIALGLLALAAALHPTTTAWFAVWLGGAWWIARPSWRPALALAAAAGAVAGIWILSRGGLGEHFRVMDPAWLAVLDDKDYLFPLGWPVSAWLTNLLAIPVILLAWRARVRRGLAIDRESPLVIGALLLPPLFVVWLPFNAAHVALAVQLQLSRVFWMLDIFATIYLVWAIAEAGEGTRRRAVVTALVLLAASTARGVYAGFFEFPDRPLFAVHLRDDDWGRTMAWVRSSTQVDSTFLADPLHAARYGSSLRVGGRRDVFLERVKDGAIAMYDRDVAMRMADRERALDAHPWNTEPGARALASRYGLDYLIADRQLALPLAFKTGALFVYDLNDR